MFRSQVSSFRKILIQKRSFSNSSSSLFIRKPFSSYNNKFISFGISMGVGVYLYSKLYSATTSKARPEVLELFETFATGKLNGVKVITIEDIRRLVGPLSEDKIRILCELISETTGPLTLDRFVELYELLSRPDAEYRIAFMLADKDHNGFITKDEFQHVIVNNLPKKSRKFNWSSEWVNLFFGKDGEGHLSYLEFSQLLDGLQREQVRQEFLHNFDSKTGLVTPDQFIQILRRSRINLPPGIEISRIRELANVTDPENDTRGEGISYAQFRSLSKLITHLPSYGKILGHAIHKTGKDKITRDDFMRSANILAVPVTPMECDMAFFFFDTKKDGCLDIDEFKAAVRIAELEPKRIPQRMPVSHPVGSKDNDHKGAETPIQYLIEGISHFGLGAIAGGIGATAVYPIDLVKTRMQNQKTLKGSTEKMYKHSIDCFIKVIKHEGFIGLYRGLGPQLVGVAPEKAIKLTMNDLLRGIFTNKDSGDIYFPLEAIAGGGAGASQVIFTNPLEIVKIRLQVQGEAVKKGIISSAEKQTAISIVRELGFSGLYKGASACLLRDVPFSAIYFPTYAKMKKQLTNDGESASPLNLLLAGAIAGVPAAALVTPADVIKTRMQVKNTDVVYKGIIDCSKHILQAEGFSAFWKGALARVFRSSPQFGVTLVSYELLQRLFGISSDTAPNITNVPVTANEMNAFKRASDKIQQVEKRWFDLYSKG